MAGNIMVGTSRSGAPVKVLVDGDGRVQLSEDAPVEMVQIALMQAMLRQTIALRLGMIAAGTCKEMRQADVDFILDAVFRAA